MDAMHASDTPEFLNVTLYVDDITEIRHYYHEVLGLPIVFEEPGQAAVMGDVAVHDPSEGPVNTSRLYFLVDDPSAFADRAKAAGVEGTLRVDGYGQPAWESLDPFGNSFVLLKRGDASA